MTHLIKVEDSFIVLVGECQTVVQTKQQWSNFYQDVMKLPTLLKQAIGQNEKNALKTQKQQEKVDDGIGD
jgi:hypothetical protein